MIQTVAVGAHEVAHLRGVTSEVEAELVRDFVIDNQAFLINGTSLSGLVQLQDSLANVLIEPSLRYADDKVLQKEERCMTLVHASERLGGLHSVLIGDEIRDLLEGTLGEDCIGSDQQSLPRKATASSMQSRSNVVSISSSGTEMVRRIELRRRQMMEILSSFYSWHYENFRAESAEQILLSNAVAPLLHEDGTWQNSLSDEEGLRLRAGLKCTVDDSSAALAFTKDQCPAADQWESYPLRVRDYTFTGKTCAVFRHRDSKGFMQQALLINGPHTINSDGQMHSEIRDYRLNDVVNLEILLNVNESSEELRKGDWRTSF